MLVFRGCAVWKRERIVAGRVCGRFTRRCSHRFLELRFHQRGNRCLVGCQAHRVVYKGFRVRYDDKVRVLTLCHALFLLHGRLLLKRFPSLSFGLRLPNERLQLDCTRARAMIVVARLTSARVPLKCGAGAISASFRARVCAYVASRSSVFLRTCGGQSGARGSTSARSGKEGTSNHFVVCFIQNLGIFLFRLGDSDSARFA